MDIQPDQQEPTVGSPTQTPVIPIKDNSKKRLYLIVGAVIIALVIVAGFVFAATRHHKDTASMTPMATVSSSSSSTSSDIAPSQDTNDALNSADSATSSESSNDSVSSDLNDSQHQITVPTE